LVLKPYLERCQSELHGKVRRLLTEISQGLNRLKEAPEIAIDLQQVKAVETMLLTLHKHQPISLPDLVKVMVEHSERAKDGAYRALRDLTEKQFSAALTALYWAGLCYSPKYPGSFVSTMPLDVPVVLDNAVCKAFFPNLPLSAKTGNSQADEPVHTGAPVGGF
jgi:hypothetical protein